MFNDAETNLFPLMDYRSRAGWKVLIKEVMIHKRGDKIHNHQLISRVRFELDSSIPVSIDSSIPVSIDSCILALRRGQG